MSFTPSAPAPAALPPGLTPATLAASHPLQAIEHASTVPAAETPAPVLDAEKLICYDLALELQLQTSTLVPANHRVLQDQLERASLSVVLCIAEGAGRRSRRDKQHYYAMARGSATETAAIIDVLRLRRLASIEACRAARSHALRVVQLLSKLHASLA